MNKYALILLLFLFPGISHSIEHVSKDVKTVLSPDSRPCSFFLLNGVTEADSVVPNNGWFAVPISHSGHDVIISILLTAFTTGKPVNVSTTGAAQCGHAEVSSVHFSY